MPSTSLRNEPFARSVLFLYKRTHLIFLFKPLVSRENLFYEAVESAAPPLLGFIPRYLGVMLVNYRKVRKPPVSHTPHSEPTPAAGHSTPLSRDDTSIPETGVTPNASLSSPPRPPLRKAVTAQGISASERAKEQAEMYSSPAHTPPRPHSGLHDDEAHHASGEDTDAEQPVVQLDSNPHILPGWMLRGRREYYRSLPGAIVLPRGLPGATEEKNPLSRLQHSHRAVVSNPDLFGVIHSSTGNILGIVKNLLTNAVFSFRITRGRWARRRESPCYRSK